MTWAVDEKFKIKGYDFEKDRYNLKSIIQSKIFVSNSRKPFNNTTN